MSGDDLLRESIGVLHEFQRFGRERLGEAAFESRARAIHDFIMAMADPRPVSGSSGGGGSPTCPHCTKPIKVTLTK